MDGVIVREGSPLFGTLAALARDGRLVFFAGLPGTGKSLLIHQLAHLAHARGRRVHLLQWDVARPVFEASRAGRRYPQVHGVTHGVIRLAVGRWARDAVARWHARHGRDHLLVGETPFIGHRLVSLARPEADEAEAVLAADATRFVIPVPSRELRAHLERERERRAREPRHAREREDAPPAVLRALWRELFDVAAALGITPTRTDDVAYDPDVYRRVYERLLAHRHATALALEARLPAEALSAYDFRIQISDVVPTADEASRLVEETEARYPQATLVDRELEAWYRVSR